MNLLKGNSCPFGRIGDLFVDLWNSESFKIWDRGFADRKCSFDILLDGIFKNIGELQYDLKSLQEGVFKSTQNS